MFSSYFPPSVFKINLSECVKSIFINHWICIKAGSLMVTCYLPAACAWAPYSRLLCACVRSQLICAAVTLTLAWLIIPPSSSIKGNHKGVHISVRAMWREQQNVLQCVQVEEGALQIPVRHIFVKYLSPLETIQRCETQESSRLQLSEQPGITNMWQRFRVSPYSCHVR